MEIAEKRYTVTELCSLAASQFVAAEGDLRLVMISKPVQQLDLAVGEHIEATVGRDGKTLVTSITYRSRTYTIEGSDLLALIQSGKLIESP